MPFGLGPTELIIILAIILIIFGPTKLPQLGRSIGQGIRALKGAAEGDEEDTEDEEGKTKKKTAKKKADEDEDEDEDEE